MALLKNYYEIKIKIYSSSSEPKKESSFLELIIALYEILDIKNHLFFMEVNIGQRLPNIYQNLDNQVDI